MKDLPPSLQALGDRFWSKVRFTPTCWLWTAHIGTDGYGQYRVTDKHGRRLVEVHRYVLEAKNGKPIRAGFFAMHVCRNRNCCNPYHLRLGTNRENSLERSKDALMKRGRAPRPSVRL